MPPLTTKGDLLVRGPLAPQPLPAGADGHYLQGKGAGNIPGYTNQMPPLTTIGDLIMFDGYIPIRLIKGVAGAVLISQGASAKLTYKSLFNLLTTRGDLWVHGGVNPQRLAAGALNKYFKGQGAGELPIYEKLALRDTGTYIGTSERESGGNQVITGVGFRPSIIIFIARGSESTDQNWSIGFANLTHTNQCLSRTQDGLAVAIHPHAILMDPAGAWKIEANLTVLSSDGFTLAWTLLGTALVYYTFICLP
ncbi:hypothetical protein ES705_26737 [subsurface metagenome]